MIAGMIISFIPWIILNVLPTHTLLQLKIVISIALVLTPILNIRELRKWFILPWGTLIFFLVNFILLVIFRITWTAENMNLLAPGFLALIVWISLFIGQPFTLQYAKLQIAKEKWNTPGFIFVNRVLTITWGTIFLVNLGINILQLHYSINQWMGESATYITSIFGIWLTIWFPRFYAKLVQRRQQK